MKWAVKYTCFIVVDITGGMGVSTSRKLLELGHKDFFYDGIDPGDMWKFNPRNTDKTPGLNFNNKRAQIVQALEEQFRTGFKIRSNRLLNELNTFVYINGRPDHMSGHHDDLIMSMAMALYVAQNSFSNLRKNANQAKAMLDSWVIRDNQRPNQPKQEMFNQNPGSMFEQGTSGHIPQNNPNNPRSPQDYSWLFGGLKR